MGRTLRILAIAGVCAGCLVGAGTAWAAKTVCSSGCAYASINAAISGASPGATITIAPGSYYEDVVVNKAVTLSGSGTSTVIYPSVSKPECAGGEGEGSLCPGSSSVIEIEASKVTISKLAINGNNPNLTSSVVREGQEIDARNGIIVNFDAGTFNEISVYKVSVSNVFLRGIYQGSEGTFNFTKDTVNNVQGGEESIAMFDFGSSGVFSHDTVTNANDAISANWSRGTTFEDNKVSKSGSGVHTDNNGGFGGIADVIKGNTIQECSVNGHGIFVFAPYVSPTVESNKIQGCAVGIAAFGSSVSGQGPKFVGNRVQRTGATTTESGGTYGAYITTSLIVPEYGYGDVTATLEGNSFERFGTALLVTQAGGDQATVTAVDNSFRNDGTGANGETGTVVEAKNNWWGCRTGPNTGRCDTAIGTVSFTPWLTSRP